VEGSRAGGLQNESERDG